MHRILTTLIIAAIGASAALAAPALTMQDIQALAKQKSWSELLDSAYRVEPAARSKDWEPLVRTAAANVVTDIAKSGDSDWRAAAQLAERVPELERRYTFLTADKPYVQAKADVIARAAAACAKEDGYGCGGALEQLSSGVPKFASGTARIIALSLAQERSAEQAIHFFSLAADDDLAICGHGEMQRSVIGTLRSDATGARLTDAQHAAGRCYDALESALVKEMMASDEKAKPRPAFLRNGCGVLKSHGKLTVLKKRKCP